LNVNANDWTLKRREPLTRRTLFRRA